jgi:phosphate acyltransferase
LIRQLNIAVDIMGGDQGPRSCFNACLKFLSAHPDVQISVFGDCEQLGAFIPDSLPAGLNVHHAPNSVTSVDKPGIALRSKRDSSMAMAVKLVADGGADACVSAGNTGALMAFGLHFLGLIDGVDRPAICKGMPSLSGSCYLLDIGANVSCSAQNLFEFARLGVDFARSRGIPDPRVGLLNVGTEAQKGAELQRDAFSYMNNNSEINFIGFVEGGDIYRGVADVVVCDGFSGNVLLKASEGAADLMRSSLKLAFNQNILTRLAGVLAYPVLSSWQSQFDPNRHNGAAFLGLKGVVVKSHGSSGETGWINALQVAVEHLVNRS